MIIAKNYLEVYPYDKWSAKEIHVYQMGETFRPNIEMVDGTTAPPKLLTEADLIALMEKHGIGTDATHAEHIEKIKSRLYVGLENEKFFVPGHLGMGLVEGYDNMGYPMSKPNLRAELESDLVKICEGRRNPEVVLKEQLLKYKEVFEVALQQAAKIDEALAIYLQEPPCQPEVNINNTDMQHAIYKCPACGSDMVLRTKRDGSGKFISCMSYPHCRIAVWFPSIVEEVETTDETCPQCGPTYKKLKFKFRRGALPRYYIPEDMSCIGGCDRDLLDILDIQITNVRSNTNTPNTTFSSNSSLSSSRGPSSNSSFVDSTRSTQFPVHDNTHSSNNTRNPSRNARGRGTAKQGAGGQRSILDIFQRPGGASEPLVSNTRTAPSTEHFDEPNGDVSVMCNCNHPALLLTVRKEGPNKGRPFYKCGNQNQCNFFQWGDSTADHMHPRSNNDWNSRQTGGYSNDSGMGRTTLDHSNTFAQNRFQGNSNNVGTSDGHHGNGSFSSRTSNNAGTSPINSAFNASSGRFTLQSSGSTTNFPQNTSHMGEHSESAVVCSCNENALLLTVRKEGPNKGRQFYKCNRSSCNFFQWADNATNNIQNSQNSLSDHSNVNSWQQHQTGTVSGYLDHAADDNVRCRCGGPAKRLVVQKDGPNKGRPFYSCPKTVERCQFFLWADEGSSNTGGSSGSNWQRNNQGGGSTSSNSSDGRKKRKCGNCHEEGHTKRTCPNN